MFLELGLVYFETPTSKWVDNKIFMHLNVVVAAILWDIWNNGNGLGFKDILGSILDRRRVWYCPS